MACLASLHIILARLLMQYMNFATGLHSGTPTGFRKVGNAGTYITEKLEVLFRSVRSVFTAKGGDHSEKPEEFYQIVGELSPGPYLELFGRRRREGWTVLGNELDPADWASGSVAS